MERFRIGVDENGLGPRLGPLVVTAVIARVTEEGCSVASRRPKGALAKRLGDSKAMIAHGDVALGEAWARAVGRRVGVAAVTRRPDPRARPTRNQLRRSAPARRSVASNAEGESYEADDKMVVRPTPI
jgi:hypothetical protein